MKFKKLLNSIKDDLELYNRPKDQLRQLYIEERLNKSLVNYYNELSKAVLYLSDKDQIRTLKNINRRK